MRRRRFLKPLEYLGKNGVFLAWKEGLLSFKFWRESKSKQAHPILQMRSLNSTTLASNLLDLGVTYRETQ
jgi:hypothetical protein